RKDLRALQRLWQKQPVSLGKDSNLGKLSRLYLSAPVLLPKIAMEIVAAPVRGRQGLCGEIRRFPDRRRVMRIWILRGLLAGTLVAMMPCQGQEGVPSKPEVLPAPQAESGATCAASSERT